MKKLKLKIRHLLYRKLVVTIDSMNMCRVWHVEKSAEKITEALGMFPDRVLELKALCKKEYKEKDDVVEVMVAVSKECRHANELYYCSMYVTRLQIGSQNPPSIFDILIGSVKKD